MKNSGLSITAFAIVIFAIVATLAMIAFSDGIRRIEWMSLEGTAWACFGMSFLGCLLGWCSFRRPLGKLSAIIGTFAVAGFLIQLMSATSPSHAMPPDQPSTIKMNAEQGVHGNTH
jgi:uncharacterized membrane protein